MKTLGGLSSAPADLPSSRSALSALRGESGGWGKVAISTALRTLLIVPGMWFAGGKGWRLWAGAGAASATVTAFLLFWYAAQENGRREVAASPPPNGGALPSPGTEATLEGLFGRHTRRPFP